MAPPKKPCKSDISLKAYALSRDMRRCLDEADRAGEGAKTLHLTEALAEARKLERYLAQTVENKLALAGNGQAVYNAGWQTPGA